MVVKITKPGRTVSPTSRNKVIPTKPRKPHTHLVKLENVYKQIFDSSSDAIRVISKDFTVLRINKAFAEIAGVDHSAVIGKKCFEVFPSPMCRTPDCRLRHILSGEKTIQVEIERTKKDGTIIPCSVITSPMIDETGKLTGIIEQFRDITEHRRMKGEIKESEDRYRALIELGTEAGEAIVMLQDIDGKEGIQTFFNDQWPKTIGYTKNELLGTSFFELVHPSDRLASIERHRQKMSGETVAGLYEMKLIRKDGLEIFVELTGAYTTYGGKRANVMFIRDITKRKQTEIQLALSEKQYQTIFENAPVSLMEYDNSELKKFVDSLHADGVEGLKKIFCNHPDKLLYGISIEHVNKINKYAENLWGVNVAQRKRLTKKLIKAKTINRDMMDGFLDYIVRLSQKRNIPKQELSFRVNTGRTIHILQQISILPGYEDTWGRVLVADIDITELKTLENELKRYQDHLEDIIKERSKQLVKAEAKTRQALKNERILSHELQENIAERIEFTRALVHELKTPLTPLAVCSESLIKLIKTEPELSLVKNVHNGAINLSQRIEELLDLARSEVGNLTLSCRTIIPSKLLREVFAYITPLAATKQLNLSLEIPVELPKLQADKSRLFQVFLNLLDNAIKYTPPGGAITIRATTQGQWNRFEIRDTGPGMDKERQKLLFQPYKRFGASRYRVGGLGLGLVLAKDIVELHNGKITVVSKKGEGSTFTVLLPHI